MNNELRKIVEQRLKNAKSNALAVGTETVTGKMFTGKAELLESILDEYVKGISECKHDNEQTHQGDGFVYVTCKDCGADL